MDICEICLRCDSCTVTFDGSTVCNRRECKAEIERREAQIFRDYFPDVQDRYTEREAERS